MDFTLPFESQSQLIFTIAGLLLLLGGWIIFRMGSRLLGVGLGAGFGFFLGEVLNVVLKVDRTTGLYITIGCSVIGAFAAMFFIRAVTNFLFALIGLLFGALLGRLGGEFYANFHDTQFALTPQTGVIILVVAGATALLAVWLQRFIMILITSYMGATFLVAGVVYLATKPWAFPACLAGGIIWQGYIMNRIFRSRKKYPRRHSPQED